MLFSCNVGNLQKLTDDSFWFSRGVHPFLISPEVLHMRSTLTRSQSHTSSIPCRLSLSFPQIQITHRGTSQALFRLCYTVFGLLGNGAGRVHRCVCVLVLCVLVSPFLGMLFGQRVITASLMPPLPFL